MLETENYWKNKINQLTKIKEENSKSNENIARWESKVLDPWNKKNANNNERISISADISILAKESKNLEHLTPPFSEWKKFKNI